MNFVTYVYKIQFMKRIVVVIILIAFIGAVAFARLTRANRTENKKAPEKQEQKMEQKKESKRHCMFS
jgi:flagellar biosynthesis/type III secretory pathway M-ring protein FliF/YscJ